MQDVKKFLDAFLDSENPGVVAIKGDWGAGKTYFVSHYLQERPAIANKLVSPGALGRRIAEHDAAGISPRPRPDRPDEL
jgi:hypothetical protein